jgi:endonuclease YncB( thermonuclease family)
MKIQSLCLVSVLSIFTGSSYADLQGVVVRVVDGDTLIVLSGNDQYRVRLLDIDAPESKQPFGQRAKQELLKLTAHKNVIVKGDAVDRYGRSLGTLYIAPVIRPEQVSINEVMVKEGMAWAYRYKGKATSGLIARIESEAKGEGKGLWQDPEPVEPWKWRKSH